VKKLFVFPFFSLFVGAVALITLVSRFGSINPQVYPRFALILLFALPAPFIQSIYQYVNSNFKLSIILYGIISMILMIACVYFWCSETIGGSGFALEFFAGAVSPAFTVFPFVLLINRNKGVIISGK